MSHSYVPQHPPHSFQKKILTTLAAVAIVHVAVLWAVSHLQTPELKKIEKEPLQVRFVKIQQAAPPPPTPQVQPPKPVPKEVKVVEQAPPPPPKKVERVQQVKTEAVKKVTPVAPKPAPKAAPETPVVPVVEAPPPKPTAAPAPVVVEAPPAPAPAPTPAPVQHAAPAAPKHVSIGGAGVQWSRSPRPQYSNKDLQGEARHVVVEITADENGKVTQAHIVQSSGLPALDEKILRSVRSARFKPYKENGVAYPIKAQQPFDLTLNPKG